MLDEAIYTKLTQVFEDTFDEAISLRPNLTAEEVEGWDSVQHIRLILNVEKAFGVRFSASEVGEPRNIGELVEMIKGKVP